MAKINFSFSKRMAMLLLAFVLTFSTFAMMVVPASAATCANWISTSVGAAYCDPDVGCGVLWLSETQYQNTYQRRTCLEQSGNTYYEYQTVTNKLGCC